MSTSSLDAFPDLCLIAIFLHLPLSDLLTVVGLVCSRWYTLLPIVLARRRTLKIVQTELINEPITEWDESMYSVRRDDGSPWAVRPKVDRHLVVVPVVAEHQQQQLITRQFVDGLLVSFRNITNLYISQHIRPDRSMFESITQVSHLLAHWQDSLVCLTLSIYNLPVVAQHPRTPGSLDLPMKNLFDTINQMRSLRHLKMKIRNIQVTFDPDFPIFSQLNSLSIDQSFWFIGSIQRYANPDVLTQVAINEPSCSLDEWNGRFSDQLASKFTSVNLIHYFSDPIGQEPESLQMFDKFCTRFALVRQMQMHLTGDSLHMIVPSLAKLQHLVHLHMIVSRSDFDDLTTELAQVLSVRSLSIIVTSSSHKFIETLQLPQLFPNVQVFKMFQTSMFCLDCNYDKRDECTRAQPMVDGKHIVQVWPIIDQCKRMARQVLTQFPKLHTVHLSQYPGTNFRYENIDIITTLEQL